MIRRSIERNLERSLQIYNRNENKKTNLTQKEETAPKPSSRTPEPIKVEASANDLLGAQNLSMISYNNKKNIEKDSLSRSVSSNNDANSPETKELKLNTDNSARTASRNNSSADSYFQQRGNNISPQDYTQDAIQQTFGNNDDYKTRFYDEQATANTGIIARVEDSKTGKQITIRNKNDETIISNTQVIEYESDEYTYNPPSESYILGVTNDKKEKGSVSHSKETNTKIVSQEMTYDQNGNLIKYKDNIDETLNYLDSSSKESYINSLIKSGIDLSQKENLQEDIFDAIIDEIYKTNVFGLPTTADDLAPLILQHINPNNVQEFLDYYQKNNKDGESFQQALKGEFLNKMTKDAIKNHLNEAQLAYKENNKNIVPEQSQTPDKKHDVNVNNKRNDDYVPTIDGGELPEVVVTGKAGDKVTVKDEHTFVAQTDDNGNINYRVQDQDGNVSYISTEVFDKMVKNGNGNVADILNNYGVNDAEDVSEELVGFDWTNDAKANIENELKEKYGDYQFSVAYNFDGSYSFEIFTKDGKNITQAEALNGIDKPLEDKTTLKQDKTNNATKLPEQTGWNSIAGKTLTNKYSNGDGTLNTDAMINDWKNAGGSVYTYSGSAAQNAFSSLKNAAATGNYNDFYSNLNNYSSNNNGYTEDWSWTGFDVFSVGGGWNDPLGTMSFYGGGGGSDWLCDADGNQFANHKDVSLNKHAQVMIQECR